MNVLVIVVMATIAEYTAQAAINDEPSNDYLKARLFDNFYPIAIYMSTSKKTDNNMKLLLKHKMADVQKYKKNKGKNNKKMKAIDTKLIRSQKLSLPLIVNAAYLGYEFYKKFKGK